MRVIGISAAALIFGAAAFFGLSGRWPWHRLSGPPAAPIAVAPPLPTFTETTDTLRRGETLSDLLARHKVAGIDFHRLDPALSLNPRRLRAGLVFNFRQGVGDSTPSHIIVRTTPEQRVTFSRVSTVGRRSRSRSSGNARNGESRDRSTTRCMRRSTPASPTTSSTAATDSGWPGTWPTSTPGKSTSPGTSGPATGSRWSSTDSSRRTARSASGGCWQAILRSRARA